MMANLTETAYYTRKIIKYGAIFLVVFFVLRFSLKTAHNFWTKLHPPPPPPPTVAFGKLPKLIFPESTTDKPKLTFKLETIEGGLPKLKNVAAVYFMPRQKANLLALERASLQAQKIGFKGQPELVKETVYRWTSQNTPPTILEMDITSGSFYLRYEYENDQELLTNKSLPANQQAAQEAKNFLVANGLLADDLAAGSAEFDYLRLDFPKLVPAISFSEADFTRVNLFRADLDNFKILPPNPKNSLISFLFSGSKSPGKKIIEINYSYSPIEKESLATYPLKPAKQAWEELQTGQTYIANLGQNENGQITVRKVYLAFYEDPQSQSYLQPIYVFEGDRNFFAYVPAVDSKWTE